MRVFGKLEKPPVTYLHQKHTEALEKQNKDCSTCHLSQKDEASGQQRMSTKYMRLADTSKKEVMNIYHDNCIACHKEIKSAKEKSGPVDCGGCHQTNVRVVSSWKDIGMDKSLHYRHSKAMDQKCEQCHHEYNEATKKAVLCQGRRRHLPLLPQRCNRRQSDIPAIGLAYGLHPMPPGSTGQKRDRRSDQL